MQFKEFAGHSVYNDSWSVGYGSFTPYT